ncbi:hypothetical protein DFA_10978 [Cavenderia fasciculata]|uniref:Purple acid phosphatase n=1 Tax=Cavenderia fasciculata TaxID=261658 RepID=F4QBY0_CACFS|nr:uncharacterized protein DFA_10978 [Cavenderia fasciculata]EGG14718.1 hypothetical protein DFA_10978 [Cavenderia fasciculata]|eukprot:XP_004351226.1 hypothetical protein DFA_10978 [Cavenderia fasciculata]
MKPEWSLRTNQKLDIFETQGCLIYSQPTISTSPEILNTSGDNISIFWKGINNASINDMIAIYYPPNSNILMPIGFIMCSDSVSWKEGYGSVEIPLVNVRDTYVFRLWIQNQQPQIQPVLQYDNATLSLVATSNNVTFQNPFEPTKVYTSLTNSSSEIRIMWISGTNDQPFVQYGLSPSQLYYTSTGTSVTYTIDQMCAAPANDPNNWRDPGYFQDVVIDNLTPSTTYYYRVGSKNSGMSVQTYQLVSPPKIGTEAYVVAFGDLGVETEFIANFDNQPSSIETIANINTIIKTPLEQSQLFKKLGRPLYQDGLMSGSDFRENETMVPWAIHHIGDISYARGVAVVWDYFQDMMEDVTSYASYQVAVGNHDYDFIGQPFKPSWSDYGADSGGECGIPYATRYHMPGAENQTYRNDWYSYNYGPIHFVVMSSEHDFLFGSPQYEWIVQDLQSVDRMVTPWIVFSGHRPMYASELLGIAAPMYDNLRETYEPLLIKYNVNLVLTGHIHAYERICGINNFTCASSDNDAPVHVLIGMAGCSWLGLWTDNPFKPLVGGVGEQPQPEWSIFRTTNYGYTRFYANQTDLLFEYVGNHRNLVHDSFWLKNNYYN